MSMQSEPALLIYDLDHWHCLQFVTLHCVRKTYHNASQIKLNGKVKNKTKKMSLFLKS